MSPSSSNVSGKATSVIKVAGLLFAYILAPVLVAIVWALIVGATEYRTLSVENGSAIQMLGGLVFLLFVFIYLRKRDIPFLEAFGLANARFSSRIFIKFALYGVSLNLLFVLILNLLPSAWTFGYAQSISVALNRDSLLLTCVSILVYAPIMEELLFRGLMLNYLRKRINPYFAAVVISVMFGLLHGQPLWIIYTTVAGIFFAVVALKTESILPSITTHFFFNATSLLIILISNE